MKRLRVTWLLLVLGFVALLAYASEQTGDDPNADLVPFPTEDTVLLEGDEALVSTRLESLVFVIAAWDRLEVEGNRLSQSLEALGLSFAPGSTGPQELAALARRFEKSHPRRTREATYLELGGDPEGFEAYERQAKLDRMEALGEELGSWLTSRAAEGQSVDEIVGRIREASKAITSRIVLTGGDREALLALEEATHDAFEVGVERTLGWLPTGLAARTGRGSAVSRVVERFEAAWRSAVSVFAAAALAPAPE